MSQRHATQASGQGMLECVFKLREHGTTARTEVIAGFTTFLMMVYIIFANPQILGIAGMDTSAVFVTTCLIAALDSIMMGLFTNLPAASTPAMGLNMFFAFVVVQVMGLSWQVGMGIAFWGVIGPLLLTVFRVCYQMITNTPVSLHVGITGGVGLFIGMIGPENADVTITNPETLTSIDSLTPHGVLLGILGLLIIAIPTSRDIHAAVLISIVVMTLLGWIPDDIHYSGIVSASPSVMIVMDHVNLARSFNLGLAGVTFSFMLVNPFGSSSTLTNMTDKVGLADEKGKFPRVKQVLYVGSISPVTGSLIETSSVTAYIEPSSGVSAGGRTSLTAMVVGLLLLLAVLLSPLAGMVPGYVTADTLIYVGVLMTSSFARVSWRDLTEPVLTFIIAMMIPFSFSITEGVALSFVSYCVMKIGTERLYDPSPCVIIVALPFILKIVFIDAH